MSPERAIDSALLISALTRTLLLRRGEKIHPREHASSNSHHRGLKSRCSHRARASADSTRALKHLIRTCRLKFSENFYPPPPPSLSSTATTTVAAVAQRNFVSYQCLISRTQSPIYPTGITSYPSCYTSSSFALLDRLAAWGVGQKHMSKSY